MLLFLLHKSEHNLSLFDKSVIQAMLQKKTRKHFNCWLSSSNIYCHEVLLATFVFGCPNALGKLCPRFKLPNCWVSGCCCWIGWLLKNWLFCGKGGFVCIWGGIWELNCWYWLLIGWNWLNCCIPFCIGILLYIGAW